MNNKTVKRLALVTAVVALLSSMFMSSSLAKYVTKYGGSQPDKGLNVAKWDIDVNGDTDGKITTLSGNVINTSPSVDRDKTKVVAYEEDFNSQPQDLGWVNLYQTALAVQYENNSLVQPGDNSYRMGAFLNRDKLYDADAYSMEMDLKLEQTSDSGSALFAIGFNEVNYDEAITSTSKDNMMLYIRPSNASGSSDKNSEDIGVILQRVKGNSSYNIGKYTLSDVKLGEEFHLRLDVDNIAETIKVYINETCFISYKSEEQATDRKMPTTAGTMFFVSQYGKAYIDNVKVTKEIRRPVSTVYEEDFEHNNTMEAIGWTKVKDKTLHALTVTGGVVTVNPTAASLTGDHFSTLLDVADLFGVSSYGIEMDVKLDRQNLGGSGGAYFDLYFNDALGRSAALMPVGGNGGEHDYMRLTMTPCIDGEISNDADNATEWGISLVENESTYNLLGSRTYKMTGKNDGDLFTLRMEVDNDKGVVRAYIDENLMFSIKDERINKSAGPILLRTKACRAEIDNIKVDVKSELTSVYTEDFNGEPTFKELGWETIGSLDRPELTYSNENATLSVNADNDTRGSVLVDTAQLNGADKYSIEMDLDIGIFDARKANTKPEFDIFINVHANSDSDLDTNTNIDCLYFSFRPACKGTEGAYVKAVPEDATTWAIGMGRKNNANAVLISNPKNQPIGSEVAAGSLSNLQCHLKMEVDNIEGKVVVWLYDTSGKEIIKYEYIDTENNMERTSGAPILFLNNTTVTIDNINIKRSYTNVVYSSSSKKIAPGMGGALADVTVTNNGEVKAEFEMTMKIWKNEDNGAVLPKNIVLKNDGSTVGLDMEISRDGDVFTVICRGELSSGGDSANCIIDWEWPYSFDDTDSSDTEAGGSTASMADINVKIESIQVSQRKPGVA